MADGTITQFDAVSGIDCVKVCTVIGGFSFSFLHFKTLFHSKDNASFFCLFKHQKKFNWNRVRLD